MRILKRISAIVLVLVLLCTCTPLTTFASSDVKGMTFAAADSYTTKKLTTALPSTYEATVYFPANTDATVRGGVIVGNFEAAGVACVSFEIHKNGNPRLYIIDSNNVTHDHIFTNVNVITGQPVHVAVTMDAAAGTYSCYLDGVLKQTITKDVPAAFSLNAPLGLGGDLRSGNGQFFKGTIQNLRLYADVRSAQEVAADMTTIDTTDLVGNYDLSNATSEQSFVECTEKIGPSFEKYVTMFDNLNPVTDYAYSFAVLGDIQTMTANHPDGLARMYDWLLENKETRKIEAVLGLGDMVDSYTVDAEYELVKAQMKRLEGIIPHTFVRGNHDKAEYFNKHFTYKEYKHLISGARENWDMKNTYTKLTIGGHKYLILCLDLSASNATLAWANDVVESNPDYNVIVTSHILMGPNGSYTDATKYGGSKTCQQIFDEFVSQHENIVMFLSGHHPTDNIVRKEVTGVHGNKIQQILIDPQTTDKNYTDGTGLIAMFNFSEDGSFVQVEYYSVIQEAFFLRNNQFTFQLNVVQPDGSLYVPAPIESTQLPIHNHIYTADCDTLCDICIRKRETTVGHEFKNGCDIECDVCSTTRVTEHQYDNACDEVCNECGDPRVVPHVYDNACDAACNDCGATRAVPDHVYDHDCDTSCNECDNIRTIEHKYDDYHVCRVCRAIRAEGAKGIFLKPTLQLTVGQQSPLSATTLLGDLTIDNLTWLSNNTDVATVSADGTVSAVSSGTAVVAGVSPELGVVYCVVTVTPANILNNGDFELGANATWGSNPEQVVEGIGKDGSWGMQSVRTKSGANDAGKANYYKDSLLGLLKPNTTYELSFDYKNTGNGGGQLFFVQPFGSVVYSNCIKQLSHSGELRDGAWLTTGEVDWIRARIVFITPESITKNKGYELNFRSIGGIGTTYYDNITVKPVVAIDDIQLSADRVTVDMKKTATVTASLQYTAATAPMVEWTSADETVATVKDGVITGVRAGTAVITASADGMYPVLCYVTVEDPCAEGHTYDNACDTECNICEDTRITEHKYDNACDTACNVCDDVRDVPDHVYNNTCDTDCNVCGATRTVPAHKYSHSCDKTCNVCGATRSITHKYANACDKSCNVCGTTRTVPAHKYSHSCDKTCNVCGATRSITHKYTNACDKTCNVCGATRTVPAHKYSHSCDKTCNVCGATRSITHKYTNACDTKCNVCNTTRTITHSYKTTTTKATLTKNGSIVKKCSVCGKVVSNTAIKYPKTFTLSATSYTYNGAVKKPTVTVKDSAGKTISSSNYTVTYATGRKNVGTYKVTVKMKGNYSGTKILTFKINPAKTTVSKVTPATKSLKVVITKKSTQVTGYQIQYSTSKSFTSPKAKTITSYKTTTTTLSSLKAKTTYYVRVRTYKTVSGVKYYSGWSAVKSAKTK